MKTMRWIDNAIPGDQVVCVGSLYGREMPERLMKKFHVTTRPRLGSLYTIRSIVYPEDDTGPFLHFEEVVNPLWPDEYYHETSFHFDGFFPIAAPLTAEDLDFIFEVDL